MKTRKRKHGVRAKNAIRLTRNPMMKFQLVMVSVVLSAFDDVMETLFNTSGLSGDYKDPRFEQYVKINAHLGCHSAKQLTNDGSDKIVTDFWSYLKDDSGCSPFALACQFYPSGLDVHTHNPLIFKTVCATVGDVLLRFRLDCYPDLLAQIGELPPRIRGGVRRLTKFAMSSQNAI